MPGSFNLTNPGAARVFFMRPKRLATQMALDA